MMMSTSRLLLLWLFYYDEKISKVASYSTVEKEYENSISFSSHKGKNLTAKRFLLDKLYVTDDDDLLQQP